MRGFVSALRTITHNLTCSCAPVLGAQRRRGFVCMSSQRPPLQCASPESAAAQSGWIADCGRVPVGGARLGGNGLGGVGLTAAWAAGSPGVAGAGACWRGRGRGAAAEKRGSGPCRCPAAAPPPPQPPPGKWPQREKGGGVGRSSANGRWPSPKNTNE